MMSLLTISLLACAIFTDHWSFVVGETDDVSENCEVGSLEGKHHPQAALLQVAKQMAVSGAESMKATHPHKAPERVSLIGEATATVS
jgi:hypothetical protein